MQHPANEHVQRRKVRLFIIAITAIILLGVVAAWFTHQRDLPHVYTDEIPVGKTDAGYLFVRTCQKCGETEYKTYDALLTFVDDDAKTQAMLHWSDIIDATGIEMTAALIPGKIGDTTDYESWSAYAGWDLLEQMRDKGVDFVHHTYSHQRLTQLTTEELHEDFRKSHEILTAHGVQSNILVYPFNAYNEEVVEVVQMYYDAGISGKNLLNTQVDNLYTIGRYNINEMDNLQTVHIAEGVDAECADVKPVSRLVKEMNNAVKEEGWLVYMCHAYDSPAGKYHFDEESEQTIIDFCKHVQKMPNVKIVNLTDGLAAAQPIE